jgi:uncharacterized protein YjbI with pentapeptide repeats
MVIKNKKGEVIFDDDEIRLGTDDPDLREAVLEGVVMQGARFDGANLEGANLRAPIFTGAVFL